VTVFDDSVQFDLATGAAVVPIPDSQTAFPGTSCGVGDIGPTGIGSQVEIAFDSNIVTITNPITASLCIFDNGTLINPPGNTNPPLMIANTIVGNGEDDFLLEFDVPVLAVGFRFLTNFLAEEVVTLKDSSGGVISVEDVSALTPPNTRQFVGFQSTVPIQSVLIDTEDGNVQNEGIDAIKVQSSVNLAEILQRIEDLEEAVETLNGHTHEYLTGEGGGHNNVPVNTGPPLVPAP
jgi:hypothetical protein